MKTNQQSIALFSIILFLSFCSNRGAQTSTIWKETIATVCDRDNGFKASWICYNANEKEYKERVDGWFINVVKDEKYVMHYNSIDPTDFKIDKWHPLFEENESTSYYTGKVIRIHEPTFLAPGLTLTYVFVVNNERIEKCVDLPDNYKDMYPGLEVGQLYNVQVWTKNVYRAVIRLDKPIRKLPRQ